MKATITSKESMNHSLHLIRKNATIIFCLFLVGIYGFLTWQILTMLGAQPDPIAISAELETVGVPKVDETVVSKMQQLEDNSVSVQTLFDDARSNPFQE